ncbi:MAG TPA: nitroreductase, partial [Bacillales bacterium]|nr:nitroreductase [Bacillales bacterium]
LFDIMRMVIISELEGENTMDVSEAIHSRRSVGKVLEKPPEKEKIEKMLEAARWAPNHHKTEPWHFYVLSGEGRDKLGEAYGKINLEKLNQPTDAEREQVHEAGLKKARRSPVVIVVTVEPDAGEKIEPVEEVAATACAVQNMLLTAQELGLAVKWRTGKPASHPIMKQAFHVSDKGWVLGLLFVGYADEEPVPPVKKEPEAYTTWVD